MSFNNKEFHEILLKKYPNAFDVLNKRKIVSKNIFKEIAMIWSYFNALNTHAFKCSESFGRIYMPFQLINKDFRPAIRIGNNEKIFELFDIHCCFINLSAKIIKKANKDKNDLLKECETIIDLTNNDLYQKILEWKFKDDNTITRNIIKEGMMMWVFSNKKERKYFKQRHKEVDVIDTYFKSNFPLYYNIVTNYEIISKNEEKGGKIIKKYISKLSIECFQYESELMLNEIIPALEKEYKNIPFISLHDAIFIPEKYKLLKDEITNKILSLMNGLKLAQF